LTKFFFGEQVSENKRHSPLSAAANRAALFIMLLSWLPAIAIAVSIIEWPA
jgi:hypothetical protein